MKVIILDTNFIMYLLKYKINLFEEIERIILENYRICVLDKTLNELENLENKGKQENKLLAKLSKKFLRMNEDKINILKTKENKQVDDCIKELANKNTIIATQDKALKKSLNNQILIIRQKKYLKLIN
ncbi:hypothetical protein J4436_02365 [Candidatus Woesearchaeota archaeon]|nr:hypothetical protein [Candidatus Woesearchaeota archaeon]